MSSTRLGIYTTARMVALSDRLSNGDRSKWITNAIERYASIVDSEKPRMKRLFTHEQAARIIRACEDRVIDPLTVTQYVISSTQDTHLAELMRNISQHQRCVLCECVEQYQRRKAQGEAVQPDLDQLFT